MMLCRYVAYREFEHACLVIPSRHLQHARLEHLVLYVVLLVQYAQLVVSVNQQNTGVVTSLDNHLRKSEWVGTHGKECEACCLHGAISPGRASLEPTLTAIGSGWGILLASQTQEPNAVQFTATELAGKRGEWMAVCVQSRWS